ncbi:MAG: DNA polymerase III subunit delta [Flavobacteriales bacterium]|nr:DNA polymerase III subunit delta [Flavobacteriales bacterium]
MEFKQIIQDLKNKVYKPIYLLTGEEEYYIDRISDFIEDSVLDGGEREFNQTILYGLDTDLLTIESEAKRFPMMSKYNVVIIKEAQNLKKLDGLANYAKNPSSSTILVLNYKHSKPDGRSAFVKEVKKNGCFFQSKKLYDNQVGPWIDAYLKSKRFSIEPKASFLLIDFLGTDLSKISNELDKLMINLAEGSTITPKVIEENIGISKDFNVFELNNALGTKNILKANRIINNMGKNEKAHPLPMILPSIYRFFSQLLLFQTVKKSSEREIASALGVNPFFVRDFQTAGRNYNTKKVARSIAALRKADNLSKGIGATGMSNHEILQELIFEILHT